MRKTHAMLLATCAVLSTGAGPRISWAAHLDVLVLQQDGQLVTGVADLTILGHEAYTVGQRVYAREFDSDYDVTDPGFFALANTSPALPPGTQALPVSTPLNWDFLPMKIGAQSANIFYWNGLTSGGMPGTAPEDVDFGPLPASNTPGQHYSLTLFDLNDVGYTVDGGDEMVEGGLIANTKSDGSIHQHDEFFLDEGDGYVPFGGTPPDDGIYLVALQLRMAGLENSLPFFLLYGTPGSTFEALNDAAEPWVEEMVDTLVPTGLPGDYNGNGVVDAADYTAWRDALAVPGATLLNDPTPGSVDESDFAYWRSHFGDSLTPGGGSGALGGAAQGFAVPEPATAVLLLMALSWLAWPKTWGRGGGNC
jgi:hypothetical protein